jgi:hypothetical protein
MLPLRILKARLDSNCFFFFFQLICSAILGVAARCRAALKDPESGWTRTAEPWITGPASYPLHHQVLIEITILDLPDKLRGQSSWAENFLFSKSFLLAGLELELLIIKFASPVPYPLDHEVLVEINNFEHPDEMWGQGSLMEKLY